MFLILGFSQFCPFWTAPFSTIAAEIQITFENMANRKIYVSCTISVARQVIF